MENGVYSPFVQKYMRFFITAPLSAAVSPRVCWIINVTRKKMQKLQGRDKSQTNRPDVFPYKKYTKTKNTSNYNVKESKKKLKQISRSGVGERCEIALLSPIRL